MKVISLVRRLISIAILVGILIAFAFLKNNRDIAEFFTTNITSRFVGVMSNASRVIKFSFTEVLFLLIIIFTIIKLIMFIVALCKIKIIKALCRLCGIATSILSIMVIYSFSCEMAYARKDMPLPYYTSTVDRSQFADIYNYFADDINYCVDSLSFDDSGEINNGFGLDYLSDAVTKSYQIVVDPYFYPTNGSIKPMISSFIYRELQITGVTFSPLGEANINIYTPMTQLPITVAHELAHTKGVMREDDANKLAFYVCLNSYDTLLRYSSYVFHFDQIEAMASKLDESERASLHTINPIFYKSRNYQKEYWQKHDALGQIGDFFNNMYIKSSGVEEGVESYHGGTSYEYDPGTFTFTPSDYQMLFFDRYFF